MKITVFWPGDNNHPKDGSTTTMDINVDHVVTVSEDKTYNGYKYAEVELIRGTYYVVKRDADTIRDMIA